MSKNLCRQLGVSEQKVNKMNIPKREQFLMSKFNNIIRVFLEELAVENGLLREDAERWASEHTKTIGLDLAKNVVNDIDARVNLL
jgi:hypothetical protein